MSNRELVIDLFNKLPEDMPAEEIVRKLRIALGLPESLGAAEGLSMEEVHQFLRE
jgi:hypothetical protein